MTLLSTHGKTSFFPFQKIVENYFEAVKFLKYQRFSQEQTPLNFKKIFEADCSEKKCNLVFAYNSLIDFNTNLDKFLIFYGKPIIRKTSSENPNIETLIYKNKLKGVKVKSSLTFINGNLFLYNYVLESSKKKDFNRLKHYAFYKYGFKKEAKTEKFTDNNQNSLIINQSENQMSFNFFKKHIEYSSIFKTFEHSNEFSNAGTFALENAY